MSNALLRRLHWLCLVALIAGCGGGGCSSCLGSSVQPIRGGYPLTPDLRIPHAMQVRLTDQGLRSVQAIAPALFAGFLGTGIAVPTSTGSMSALNYVICPAGGCVLHVSLATTAPPFDLSFVPPDAISAKIRIVIHGDIPIRTCVDVLGSCSASCGGTFCVATNLTFTVDTTQGAHPFIGLNTNVAITRETHAAQLNYHRADFVSPTGSGAAIQPTMGEDIEDADFNCSSGGLCFLVNLFRGTIVSAFSGQISSALAPIQAALAATAMPDPPGCPTGTTAHSDGNCYYADGTLVPTILGTDGTGNLGGLLASITPGLSAPNAYVIAAGDPTNNAQATATGMSLGVFGAVTSNQHSQCVPRLAAPAMPTIPQWTNLQQNNIPGTTTETDLGVGIAEDFLNSTMWNLWDSGMFCLGVTTRTSQSLSASTFTALPALMTLRNVIFPNTAGAPAAMILRPQQPPVVTIGHGTNPMTDPLLMIAFHSIAIDFYAWSEERYVRFMTVTTDLSLPIDLMVDAGGIRPVIGMPTTANTVVTNSQLIAAAPATLAAVLNGVLGTAIGMFAGSVPEIALPSIPLPGTPSPGAVMLAIPATGGIQGLSEGSSRYLGLFTNLHYVAAGMHDSFTLDTSAQAEVLPFDPAVYRFDQTFSLDRLPAVRVTMGVPGGAPRVEYTYRVDDMGWSQWTRESVVDVRSPSFITQGTHHIDVRARVEGSPQTADPAPARAAFTIDTGAPTVAVQRDGAMLVLEPRDEVWAPENLELSVAFDDGAASAYSHATRVAIPSGATRYTVHVRDGSGNEGSAAAALPPEIIRGAPSPDASASGCGCRATPGRGVGAERNRAALLVALTAALVMLAVRRRRALAAPQRARRPLRVARLAMYAIPFVCAAYVGCDCSAHPAPDAGGACDGGGSYCATTRACVAMPACTCAPGFGASAMPAFDATTCMWDTTTACACTPLPPLTPGMAGSHLDMAIHTDGTVWLSSYSAGDPAGQRLYGDLIVGTFDRHTATVDWTQVDGVPATGTVGADPSGWRHGILDAGPDVGRWNSLALDAMGHPRVSYWDTTNDQLRFALFDGTAWHTHAVDTLGHNGRYTSLVILPSGAPAIAYRATVPDTTMAGHVQARVRYAVAHNATPASAADWTITDVATAPTSCRAGDCATGQVCVQSTGVCTATSAGCTPACAAGQSCIAAACADTYTATWIEDFPPGIGLFCSLARDPMGGVGLVWYDRDRGNLRGASADASGHWGTPFTIDGESAAGVDLGDRGAWASLAIAADRTWHVGYVDAWNERVMYTRVVGGAAMGAPEVVDDGTTTSAGAFTDGQHITGDSVDLDVDAMGTVRVAYQDSTMQTLRLATRATGGATWTLSVLDAHASTGYWSRIEQGSVATFWRDMQARSFGVRVQAIH